MLQVIHLLMAPLLQISENFPLFYRFSSKDREILTTKNDYLFVLKIHFNSLNIHHDIKHFLKHVSSTI